jgi:hypothetical protein
VQSLSCPAAKSLREGSYRHSGRCRCILSLRGPAAARQYASANVPSSKQNRLPRGSNLCDLGAC